MFKRQAYSQALMEPGSKDTFQTSNSESKISSLSPIIYSPTMLFLTPSAISFVKFLVATLSLSQVAPVNLERSCFLMICLSESEGKLFDFVVVVVVVDDLLCWCWFWFWFDEFEEGELGVGEVAEWLILKLEDKDRDRDGLKAEWEQHKLYFDHLISIPDSQTLLSNCSR